MSRPESEAEYLARMVPPSVAGLSGLSRRSLFKTAFGVTAALGLPSVLAGCGGGGAAEDAEGHGHAAGPATVEGPEDRYAGIDLVDPYQRPSFTLTDTAGQPFDFAAATAGTPTLLFFGYTNCPDICPTTLGEWKQVKARLGESADQVAFVFVGVDSKRDTPAAMARFVRKFDPAFVGLSGDEGAIRAAGKEFGLYFKPHAAGTSHGGDLVDHSSASYLIDPDGRLRMVYSYGVPADVISADIRKLL